MDEGHVLVIGSSGIDIKGRPADALELGTSNLGQVRNSVGGVARNVAETLARLEVPTILLTAIGHDTAGERVMRSCERVGIDTTYIRRVRGRRTGTYVALQHTDGQLYVAVADFGIIDLVDSDMILEYEHLFERAQMVMVDATLTPDTLHTIIDLATHYQVKVAADPTSPALAPRLRGIINHLEFIVPNQSETPALCDMAVTGGRESAVGVARQLVSMGAKIAVVTLGAAGLAYAHRNGTGSLKAIQTQVTDATGAGDAFSGAALFGLLHGVPIDEAMRLGITAASLTLQSPRTVLPNLSQELLYDELMA
jgi:pseudouridine kinase